MPADVNARNTARPSLLLFAGFFVAFPLQISLLNQLYRTNHLRCVYDSVYVSVTMDEFDVQSFK